MDGDDGSGGKPTRSSSKHAVFLLDDDDDDENHNDTRPSRMSSRRPVLSPIQRSASQPAKALRQVSETFRNRLSAIQKDRAQENAGPQREWSLFGQVMEHEAQLKTGTVRSHRTTPARSRAQSELPSASASTFDLFRLDGREQRSGANSSVIQSPVQESAPHDFHDPHSSDTAVPSSDEHPDYDSEDSDTSTISAQSHPPRPSQRNALWTKISEYRLPVLYRNVLKCAVAYFIASLFTFVPALSGFIADITSYGQGNTGTPNPSGHMVATVAVYFNPAKTAGAMVEADLFCLLGLGWSAFVSLGSMTMFWWLEVQQGWEWLADGLVILWIGIGMSVVAGMKIWLAKPSFNTACSMTAIILFVVVVREGGLQTLIQVSLIVLIGSIVSNLVCHTLWPQSAAQILQENMIRSLDSFATLLTLLTDTFLLADPTALHQPSQSRLQRAVESHQATFTSLKKNLTEAYSEWMVQPRWLGYADRKKSKVAYENAVGSLNRLAQHLNGLRSGTRLQHDLTKAHQEGKITLKKSAKRARKGSKSAGLGMGVPGSSASVKGKGIEKTINEDPEGAMLQAAAFIFGELVEELGPPLNALSMTCTNTLKRTRDAFQELQQPSSSSKKGKNKQKPKLGIEEFHRLTEEVERALFTFESTSNQAVMRVYRRNMQMGYGSTFGSYTSMSEAGDENEMLTRYDDSEIVFLVYFFIFTLQEFAKELASFVDAASRIYQAEVSARAGGSRWRRMWSVMSSCFWREKDVESEERKQEKNEANLKKRISRLIIGPMRRKPVFPKVRPHAPNTILTPARENLSFGGKLKQSLWWIATRLKSRTIKFAIKAGMATAILASPAFFDRTRPVFVGWRGEWALISFFVVISPTIGATNVLMLHRFLGTLFGAGTAIVIWLVASEYPLILATFGFFYSIPCFYYIVAKPEYAITGRFVLLTYNLTCLNCYNLRHQDVSILDVAFHRAAAVTLGVAWAAIVSRFWWPSEARRELGDALSDFCQNVGWLYTHLVAAYSGRLDAFSHVDSGESLDMRAVVEAEVQRHEGLRNIKNNAESASLLPAKVTSSVQTFMAMELHLQIKLIEMQGLLKQTQHEPRLKGPFPVALYRSILTSLQTILDKLHSMRCVTTREEWFTSVRRDFIIPVNKERREMAGNVILYFSVLSAAFRIKAPLPPYLPPVEKSRQRLVEAIKRLDVVRNRDIKGSRQLLFFAYALMMKGVIQELEFLGSTLQEAFGTIGQRPEDFDSLFGNEADESGLVSEQIA